MYNKIISSAAALSLVFSGAAALPEGIADEFTLTASAEESRYSYWVRFNPEKGFTWSELYCTCRSGSGVSGTKRMFKESKYTESDIFFDALIYTAFEPEFISFSDGAGNRTAEYAFKVDPNSSVTIDGVGKFYVESEKAYKTEDSGKCGDDLRWTLDNYGILTISGTGDMYDYGTDDDNMAPWKKSKTGSVDRVVLEDGLTSIGSYAFDGVNIFNDLNIPSSVKTIGEKAFRGCFLLHTLNISKGVETISREAFMDCVNLTEAVLPDTVTSLGAQTFSGCKRLESVKLPGSLTSLSVESFYNCPQLKEVTVPMNVTKLVTRSLGYYDNNGAAKVPDFTIKGHKGSAAEQYARENGINFVAIVYANDLGNVNGDNKIDQQDLALLQQFIAGWTVDINASAADVTGDGSVTGEDVALMQQYFAGWNVVFKKAER